MEVTEEAGQFLRRYGVKTIKGIARRDHAVVHFAPTWAVSILHGCTSDSFQLDVIEGPWYRLAKYTLRRAVKDPEFRAAAQAAIDANVLADFVRQQRHQTNMSEPRALFSSEIEAAYGPRIKEIKIADSTHE